MNSTTLVISSGIISIIALGIAIASLVYSTKIRTWRRYLNNKEEQPENLEEIIASIATKIKNLETGQLDHSSRLDSSDELLSHATQHIGLVRFNSLADEGGNLSFAIALLDAKRSGVVITSLYGRQGNRLYTKRIIDGVGETTLSDEEQNALFQALTPAHK